MAFEFEYPSVADHYGRNPADQVADTFFAHRYAPVPRLTPDRHFSLSRAVELIDHDPLSAQWRTSYEREVSDAAARAAGVEPKPNAVYLPLSRDMTVAGVSGSNYLTAASNPGNSFLQSLQAASTLVRLGAQVLPVLRDQAMVPVVTTAPTTLWQSNESTVISTNQPVIGARPAVPHSLAAKVTMSHQLVRQSGGLAERLLVSEIARAVAAEVDRAALAGTGNAGEPAGLIYATGIGTQSGSSLALAGVMAMLKACETANVNADAVSFVMPPAVAEILRLEQRFSGGGASVLDNGTIGGRTCAVTTAAPAATLVAGDFSNLYICTWGTLALEVDPFSGFNTGAVSLRAILLCDVMVAHPSAFCVATSVT